MTAGVMVVPTDMYETCPTLDYLWIPGPSPMYQPSCVHPRAIRRGEDSVQYLYWLDRAWGVGDRGWEVRDGE